MEKTTVYLPSDMKKALKRMARQQNTSEAVLIREAVRRLTDDADAPAPRLPLFRSSGPSIAEDIDGALDGFGSR
jgi:Arc/MetJ-type ribon-helix-helix transcriptional regulator